MTGQEFKAGWAMLTAALGFEVAESQEAFYSSQLRGLEDGAFLRGVQDLVASEGFAEFARFRRVPTLHELRQACAVAGRAPRGRPYVGGVPLGDVLGAIPADGREPLPEEAGELVDLVAARAEAPRRKLLPGPGNTGHAALARMPQAAGRPVEATPERLAELHRQAMRLVGEDETVTAGEEV